MFTGIVEAVGRVAATVPQGDGLRLVIEPRAMPVNEIAIGDSVAVNGCCLTVVTRETAPPRLSFDVSGETLRCTVGLDGGSAVNLEQALRVGDRLGGHFVSGHVDGVGHVLRFERVPAASGGPPSWLLEIEAPAELARFIAAKGSIAVNGVSLTVNTVHGAAFTLNLIPHTLEVTTLRDLAPGMGVNLEVDLVARYLERMREHDR